MTTWDDLQQKACPDCRAIVFGGSSGFHSVDAEMALHRSAHQIEGTMSLCRAPGTCCPEPQCDYGEFRYCMRLAPEAMECDMCGHGCGHCAREGT
jgi:hypothetical protein